MEGNRLTSAPPPPPLLLQLLELMEWGSAVIIVQCVIRDRHLFHPPYRVTRNGSMGGSGGRRKLCKIN